MGESQHSDQVVLDVTKPDPSDEVELTIIESASPPESTEEALSEATDLRERRRKRRAAYISGAVLAVCAGLIALGIWSGTLTSLESLRAFVESLGPAGPIVYVLLIAMQTVFPVVPGAVTIMVGPVVWGAWGGLLLNWLATIIGSGAAFLIARNFGMAIIRTFFSEATIEKFTAWTASPTFTKWFALAIFFPVAPDDLLCYIAGTTKMRFSTFMLIIVVGKPWTLAVYAFGLTALLDLAVGLFS